MSRPTHLTVEAAAMLCASIEERSSFISTFDFVPYTTGIDALHWLSYLRRTEAGRERANGMQIVGEPGFGKSCILLHYFNQHGPAPRDRDGRLIRKVIWLEFPESGEPRAFRDAIAQACVPGVDTSRRIRPDILDHLLNAAGVEQVLIDEFGNVLLAGRSAQQKSLALLRHLSNTGRTVAIATTGRARLALAADVQLLSRFNRVVELPKWEESTAFRSFLEGIEQQIPLPQRSHLSSQACTRYLLKQGDGQTGAILDLIRLAARFAFAQNKNRISLELLKEATASKLPPGAKLHGGR